MGGVYVGITGLPDYYATTRDFRIGGDLLFYKGEISKIYVYDGISIKNVPVDASSNYSENFSNGIVFDSKLYFQGYNSSLSTYYTFYFDGTSIKNVDLSGSGPGGTSYPWYYGYFFSPIIYSSMLFFEGDMGS